MPDAVGTGKALMGHHSTARQLRRIQESLQSAVPADEPARRRGPKEKTAGIDADDRQWMEYWRLPRAERLQSVESG